MLKCQRFHILVIELTTVIQLGGFFEELKTWVFELYIYIYIYRAYQVRGPFKMRDERVKSQPLDQSLLCYLNFKTASSLAVYSSPCDISVSFFSFKCYYSRSSGRQFWCIMADLIKKTITPYESHQREVWKIWIVMNHRSRKKN